MVNSNDTDHTPEEKPDMDAVATEQASDDNEEEQAPVEQNELELLKEELAAAQAKADENWDLALRAKAETDNARRRATIDVENAHKYSVEKLVNEFLPVKDSLELGLNASENADVASLAEGMDLTLKMFESALAKCGVTMVDPKGEAFDPEKHQAMTMIEDANTESGKVIDVMQKGYLLNERLIRPAMVVVAK
jgi:molecular chaperone GrpE